MGGWGLLRFAGDRRSNVDKLLNPREIPEWLVIASCEEPSFYRETYLQDLSTIPSGPVAPGGQRSAPSQLRAVRLPHSGRVIRPRSPLSLVKQNKKMSRSLSGNVPVAGLLHGCKAFGPCRS